MESTNTQPTSQSQQHFQQPSKVGGVAEDVAGQTGDVEDVMMKDFVEV